MEERSQSNLRVKKNGGNKKQCNRKDSSEEEGDIASMKQKHDAVKGRMKGKCFEIKNKKKNFNYKKNNKK